MKTALDENRLKEIIQRLVKAYNPLEIYLFGSYTWGEPDKDSDIDFFVVVEKSENEPAERIRIGLHELKGIHEDVDILVFTLEEIENRKEHPSTLVHKIFSSGVKLYEAA